MSYQYINNCALSYIEKKTLDNVNNDTFKDCFTKQKTYCKQL